MPAASRLRSPILMLVLLLAAGLLPAQSVPSTVRGAQTPSTGRTAAGRPAEPRSADQRTAARFEAIKDDPIALRAFLREMPKGGDLHSHLSGAIYAENFIRWGAESGVCIDPATFTAVSRCDGGAIPLDSVLKNQTLLRQVIDAWSMRNWELSGQSGHDHFFDTFDKFGRAGSGRTGDMIAEAASRAASGNVLYLELMNTADGNISGRMASRLGWNDDFATMRDRLLAGGFRDSIRIAVTWLDAAESRARTLLGCGTDTAKAGCGVTVRYLYQVLRGFPREQVFAQILAGFELARMDRRFVGLNLVQPEDNYIPLRDYDLHMRIIGFLKTLYPDVRVTLHAGELAMGLVTPEELCCHIREAVEVAGAVRIGHGVDVMFENQATELLDLMARRKVLVEVCLTSNDVILGVTGKHHPLKNYLAAGVPVTLATDDEGVSRIDITNEYVRAAYEHGVDYAGLKRISRNGLEHAFVAGKSLWKDATTFTPVAECASDRPGSTSLSAACRAYLAANEKARLQWELEARFNRFETKW